MSIPRGPSDERELIEGIRGLLDSVCRFLMWAGVLATLIGLGFLFFNVFAFSTSPELDAARATGNIRLFSTILTFGFMGLLVGSTYLFWGEDWLGIAQLGAAAALWAAPLYAPMMIQTTSMHAVASAALGEIQKSGAAGGILAIGVLVFDLVNRIRTRMQHGVKADLLKYGKGIKEEEDRKNVFLGKCWQLPYCRKFVRDRCPIYHSRRTCWREKVGCMCEEEVIKGAMENRAIPKESVAAARYIPHNHRLTLGQKQERCRQCVIYNEHQKHKYRALLPLVVLGFVVFYAAGRQPLLAMTQSVVDKVNTVLRQATYEQVRTIKPPVEFQEILTICFVVVALAYSLKVLEYLVFKLKV